VPLGDGLRKLGVISSGGCADALDVSPGDDWRAGAFAASGPTLGLVDDFTCPNDARDPAGRRSTWAGVMPGPSNGVMVLRRVRDSFGVDDEGQLVGPVDPVAI